MKKNFKLINKRDDAIIIEENNTLLEISAQIETDKICLKRVFHSTAIEYHGRLLMSRDDPLARWVDWKQYVSEKAYNAAIKMIRENMRQIKIDIENAKNHPLYKPMLKIVESKMKMYKTDFTYHDCLHISRMPEREFIWIVRECGTWYLSCKESHEILDYCIKHNEEAQYYHCVNDKIIEVNKNTASEILSHL